MLINFTELFNAINEDEMIALDTTWVGNVKPEILARISTIGPGMTADAYFLHNDAPECFRKSFYKIRIACSNAATAFFKAANVDQSEASKYHTALQVVAFKPIIAALLAKGAKRCKLEVDYAAYDALASNLKLVRE